MASELDEVFAYEPLPTLLDFHVQYKDLFVRAVEGPFGSGKSVGCVHEMLYIAMRQQPAADNKRYTRFAVIRESYPLLLQTTKKVIEEWMPRNCGSIKESAPVFGKYEIPLPDGTTAIMELYLIAMSEPRHVKKLRSTDFTVAWLNEATEVWADIFTNMTGRVGRYPSNRFGTCTYRGIIMDYNKPPIGHWLHKMFNGEKKVPANYKKFTQPPAVFKIEVAPGVFDYEVNPAAENVNNHASGLGYYIEQIESRRLVGDFSGIDRELCLLDVDEQSGLPVWPLFDRKLHVSPTNMEPVAGLETIVAVDTSGIHPAAVVAQFTGRHWAIFDELYGEATGFEEFLTGGLIPLLRTKYSQSPKVIAVCDPANARDSLKALKPTVVLQQAGIHAMVAPTNDIKPRIESVNILLNRNVGGILIDPRCDMLIAACAGGYKYKKLGLVGTAGMGYSAAPEKNAASHIADALQYLGLHAVRLDGSVPTAETEQVKKAIQNRIRAFSRR